MQIVPEDCEPLRVVLIGLSYTGKKLVAEMIRQYLGFKVFRYPDDFVQTPKSVAKFCFDDYRGRAVIVLEKANCDIIKNLKKRNFVNIVLVEASALKRYKNFLIESETDPTYETLDDFLKKDDKQNDEQFEKCLEYVRVRIWNRQGIDFLKEQVISKKQQIARAFRPTWEQYFMKMADIARRRSNCMKSSVGAVIVNEERRVISTGYNGTPRGLPSCFREGCQRCNSNSSKSLDQCLCLHAQQSAIIEVGINRTKGCHLYTTLYPCFSCAKIIKQAGITKIFYFQQYDKEDSGKVFLQSNFDAKTDIKQIKLDNIYY